jgi:subtilisin family serine protease
MDGATYVPPAATNKGSGVDVYVLDTGLKADHVEFGSLAGHAREVKNVWDGYITDKTSPAIDNDNHGEFAV